MACPYFYPVEPLRDASWRPVHLPLGDSYDGECRADPEPCRLNVEELKICNLGYGRGRCGRFPDAKAVPPLDGASGPDAARFLITSDDGSRIVVSYVLERGHLPHSHGRLEYDVVAASFVVSHTDPIANRQAEAYVEAYLRRKTAVRHAAARCSETMK